MMISMKKFINTYQFAFVTTWHMFIIALMVFPGFEAKGFIFGVIVGYLPFLLLDQLNLTFFHHNYVLLVLVMMTILSGMFVWFCAWLMDLNNISHKILWLLMLFVIGGFSVIYYQNINYFDTWKHSNISAIMPEGYELTYFDYMNRYLIPKILVGGIWAVYLIAAIGALYSVAKIYHTNYLIGSKRIE